MASASISKLPPEPLPWRPNNRPKLPSGALLDIPDDLLYDILTEFVHIEDVCRLDSALCQKWRRRRADFLRLLSTTVLLFNRERVDDAVQVHRALGSPALFWILKRGIHLASLCLVDISSAAAEETASAAVSYSAAAAAAAALGLEEEAASATDAESFTAFGEEVVASPETIHPSSPELEFTRIRYAIGSLVNQGLLNKLETINFSSCGYVSDSHLTTILSKCYGSLKSIDIRGCDLCESSAVHIKRCTKLESFTPNGNESAAEMVEIFQTCRKLRMLYLDAFGSKISDEVVLSIAELCPILEHLSLEVCSGVSDASIRSVIESCPLLQWVNLDGCSITDATVMSICKNCPRLTVIYLDRCYELSEMAVLAVAESFPGLVGIGLAFIAGITSSAVEKLASKCRKLEYINLSYSPNVSDFTISKIAENCSKLTKLYFDGSENVTDAAVLAIAERLPGLTHIGLSGIEAITSSAVETLASKCRELKYIDLSYCTGVNDVTLMAIAVHCSKTLETLLVSGCSNVTAVGLTEIALNVSSKTLKTICVDGELDELSVVQSLRQKFPRVIWDYTPAAGDDIPALIMAF